MSWRRFQTFTGGIVLPEEKHTTRERAITPLAPSGRLRVSLDTCGLGTARAEVSPGLTVRAGQRIGSAGGGQVPVFSPVDGAVAGVEAGEQIPAPAVVIVPDAGAAAGADLPIAGEPPGEDPPGGPDAIIERVADAGVVTHTAPTTPLAAWIEQARMAGVDTLIANGLEHEPYLTGEHRLLVERGTGVVEGLWLLARAAGAGRLALAVDARHAGRYRQAGDAARRRGVEPLAVEPKYPVGHPVILTHVVTRRTPRPGERPFDVRVGVLDLSTCLAAWLAVRGGRAMTHRVVTVAGDGVTRPGNYWLALGSSAGEALERAGLDGSANVAPWCGGPMTGVPLEAQPEVSPTTAGVLAMPAGADEPIGVCIRCGWCTDQCPVRLDVATLNDWFELGQVRRAARYDVQACIACGVCSYVCPACIPLTHRMGRLKQAVRAWQHEPAHTESRHG